MVGRRLALGLDQERKLLEILTIPARKRLQQLQPLTGRRNVYGESIAIFRGSHEAFIALRKSFGRKLFALRRLNLNSLPSAPLRVLIHRIEAKITCNRIGRHDFRAGKE